MRGNDDKTSEETGETAEYAEYAEYAEKRFLCDLGELCGFFRS